MRPLRKVVDIAALRHNWQVLRRTAGTSRLFAVVKADAYGHGVAHVLPALADADGFAVASIDEALALRALGVKQPILLLEGVFAADEVSLCVAQDFQPCLHTSEQLSWLDGVRGLKAWLKVDSGMHRLGFALPEMTRYFTQAMALEGVAWQGVVSHFACADALDLSDAHMQLAQLQTLSLPAGWLRCFANSAALFVLPEARVDAVRVGLALYGMSPFLNRSAADLQLRPVMSLFTQVLAVRRLAAGNFAGYSQGFQALTAGNLATIALGYGDGFPRAIPSGKVRLRLNGKTYPLVGRVAMDMALLWLADDTAAVGDVVTVFGADHPVEVVAGQAGTIPYTLTTMLTARVPAEVRGG
ncbi:MAG: alanine racemase [Cardiobacteriaceae bacterium]|nr:alanine racemase [Cardiobacteriaceae bacterium]